MKTLTNLTHLPKTQQAMETFNYIDATPHDHLPTPLNLPQEPSHWVIPLTFNFTFPDETRQYPQQYSTRTQHLPAISQPQHLSTVPITEFQYPVTPVKERHPDHVMTPPQPGSRHPTPDPATPPPDLSDLATTAQELHDSERWEELQEFITQTTFPQSDHAYLQQLFYQSIYQKHKETFGKRRLEPSVKYKLRKTNPLPASITSVKFRSNNHFDDRVRALLDAVFKKNRFPDTDIIDNLVENTGLERKQIRNYFKNKRSRGR